MTFADMLRQAEAAGPDRELRSFDFIDPRSVRDSSVDPFAAIKERAQDRLFERMGHRIYDANLTREQLHESVLDELDAVVAEDPVPLTPEERQRLVAEIADHVIGLGPIESYLADPDVTEVMVNSDESIFVERFGRLVLTDSRFSSTAHLRQVIERIVSAVGRRIDESSPMVDARIPDGSRVNAILPPLAVDGPMLTIRKFSRRMFAVTDLVDVHTITPQVAEFLEACVVGRLNLLVSGGTGTGKTTLLNVLSSFIPNSDRVITIEDAVELRLRQRHVVRLESRPPNIEGRGEITIRDLVRNSLRMRPDRIIVGEVRGGEALDMLQAMNTGHEGSLTTLHANSPRDALSRLETMVLMAGTELPVQAVREQVVSALDVIVHLSRLRDGSRRVTAVEEVVGIEGGHIVRAELYRFEHEGIDDDGHFLGQLVSTGCRPAFSERLSDAGVDLPQGVFQAGAAALPETSDPGPDPDGGAQGP